MFCSVMWSTATSEIWRASKQHTIMTCMERSHNHWFQVLGLDFGVLQRAGDVRGCQKNVVSTCFGIPSLHQSHLAVKHWKLLQALHNGMRPLVKYSLLFGGKGLLLL